MFWSISHLEMAKYLHVPIIHQIYNNKVSGYFQHFVSIASKESYNDIQSDPGSRPKYRAEGNLKMFTSDTYCFLL